MAEIGCHGYPADQIWEINYTLHFTELIACAAGQSPGKGEGRGTGASERSPHSPPRPLAPAPPLPSPPPPPATQATELIAITLNFVAEILISKCNIFVFLPLQLTRQ